MAFARLPVTVNETFTYSNVNAGVAIPAFAINGIDNEPIDVPDSLKGEARGVKQQGGVLDFVTRSFEIEVLPADIPESVEVDVSELLVNMGVRIRDVMQNVKWTPVSDPDTMLVHVVTIKAEEEPAAAEAAVAAPGAAAEPEVIKKGKTEKDKDEAKS